MKVLASFLVVCFTNTILLVKPLKFVASLVFQSKARHHWENCTHKFTSINNYQSQRLRIFSPDPWEKGVGKTLFAKILHHEGQRGLKPFEFIDCTEKDQDLLSFLLGQSKRTE